MEGGREGLDGWIRWADRLDGWMDGLDDWVDGWVEWMDW